MSSKIVAGKNNRITKANGSYDYIRRVQVDGGQINSIEGTGKAFQGYDSENTQMLLSASGGMKLTGNKVDKFYEFGGNDVEWTGNNRPELHKTLDGKYQVCVEKEETNIIHESDFTKSWWTKTNVSVIQEGSILGYPAYRISELDSGYNQKAIRRLSQVFDPSEGSIDKWVELYIKPDNLRFGVLRSSWTETSIYSGGSAFTLNIDFQEKEVVSIGTDYIFREMGQGVFYLAVRDTSSSGSSNATRYSFNILNEYRGGDDNGEYDDFQNRSALIALPSAYQALGGDGKRYPTLPIWSEGGETTRLAPATVIENALPETGTIAGVVDMVNAMQSSPNTFGRIFDNNLSNNSRSFLRADNKQSMDLQVRIFGADGGFISTGSLWNFPYNSRSKFAYQISYGNGEMSLKLLNDGNLYRFTSLWQDNGSADTGALNIPMGHSLQSAGIWNSCRFEKPHTKDEIIRVSATDLEDKHFFENLTKGTSQETKASEMTIV